MITDSRTQYTRIILFTFSQDPVASALIASMMLGKMAKITDSRDRADLEEGLKYAPQILQELI